MTVTTIERVKRLGLSDGDAVRYWHPSSGTVRSGVFRGVDCTVTPRSSRGVSAAPSLMPFVLVENVDGEIRRIAPAFVLREMGKRAATTPAAYEA